MIPFVDLKLQYRNLKTEIDQALARALENSTFILGPDVAAFENEFARYVGSRHAIAVNSGTSALHLALLAAGIGPGDEVITVPFTFVASVAAIRYAGATPVFVDIDPVTFNIDPALIKAAITPRTRAIMPVHLFGQSAALDPILAIAAEAGLTVIEDAAQAHGGEYHGRKVGTLGRIGAFSFYPGKNLGAYGEGGLVVTDDPAIEHTVRLLRDWGQENRYEYNLPGYNYRMEGLQGAILRVKLPYLDGWIENRRANAALYRRLLDGAPVEVPCEAAGVRHVYNVFALRSDRRGEIQQALQAAGIHSSIHYPIPIHLQKAHADLGYRAGQFPVAERIARQELSLPIYPELTESQIEQVCSVIRQAAG